MDLREWLLFFHLLGAFVAVGALTALWALVLATRPQVAMIGGDAPMRFGAIAGPLVGIGMGVALVFGIWLALNLEEYEIWDGWILGALVLWVVGGWAGSQSGRLFQEDPVGLRQKAVRLQMINSVAVLLILILMIWKPGA